MSERATSILMIVGGGLFALVGLTLLALGRDVVLAWGLITFFGAVALIGTSTVLPGRGLGPLALPIAGVLMGVGCGILAYLLITDPDEFRTSRYPPEVLIPRYQTIMENNERRRMDVKHNSLAMTKQTERPFNFYLRDKNKKKHDPEEYLPNDLTRP